MSKHLVLVGGGHAHMTVMAHFHQFTSLGHKVTLISSSKHHYYSGMGPGMLSGVYSPEDIRFDVQNIARKGGAAFIEDTVTLIKAKENKVVLTSGQEVSYDVLSCNTGSRVPMKRFTPEEATFPVKPIINLLKARKHILSKPKNMVQSIHIIGGGAAGVEIAGNVHQLLQEHDLQGQITLHAGKQLLSAQSHQVQSKVLQHFSRLGITVLQGSYVADVKDQTISLEDGTQHTFSTCFLAMGVEPSPLFRESTLRVGSDGGLLVNKYLQSVDYPSIFGGGDCIAFSEKPLAKVGVFAVRQNPILMHNLMAALQDSPMITFTPQDSFLLIFNLGHRYGLYVKNKWIFSGRIAFWIKDWIDRSFMRKFQR